MRRLVAYVIVSSVFALIGIVALAQLALGLTVFESGTPILASEVNGNFALLASALDDVAADVGTNESEIDALAATVEGKAGIPGPEGPEGPQGPPGDPSELFGGPGPASSGRGATCALGDVWLTANASTGSAVPAHGQILPIATNSSMFALLGTRYGGDGRTTFALPDLRQVEPKSANGEPLTYLICITGTFPSRN